MNDYKASAPFSWQRLNASRLAMRIGVVVVILIAVAVLAGFLPAATVITVSGMGDAATFKTKQKTVGAALAEAGVALHEKDLVTPGLETPLDGTRKEISVRIQKAIPAQVITGGRSTRVYTQAKTVEALLEELGVQVGQDDRVEPALQAELVPEGVVRVIRVVKREHRTQTEIPFETVRQEDRTMVSGDQKEVSAGEPGIRETVTLVVEEDGVPIREEVVSESVVKPAVDRVVAFGTAGVVSRGGRTFRYSRELNMTATGYTAGKESNPWATGYTYTGMKATRGVVAVDPLVIPLHSRVYVEGYGFAIAADIGGAIKGMKIDLCFDTVDEALQWGVRPIKVYVLDE